MYRVTVRSVCLCTEGTSNRSIMSSLGSGSSTVEFLIALQWNTGEQ